jgi:hypothetical protein
VAEKNRLRSSVGLGTTEAILESLRDYTHQVESLARLSERQRSRILLAGYLIMSMVALVGLIATYAIERTSSGDRVLLTIVTIFSAVTLVGLPFIAIEARLRLRQYRTDLQRSVVLLQDTMRFASQIKDHMELDRLEDILLQLRLREADATLEHASRVYRARW